MNLFNLRYTVHFVTKPCCILSDRAWEVLVLYELNNSKHVDPRTICYIVKEKEKIKGEILLSSVCGHKKMKNV